MLYCVETSSCLLAQHKACTSSKSCGYVGAGDETSNGALWSLAPLIALGQLVDPVEVMCVESIHLGSRPGALLPA